MYTVWCVFKNFKYSMYDEPLKKRYIPIENSSTYNKMQVGILVNKTVSHLYKREKRKLLPFTYGHKALIRYLDILKKLNNENLIKLSNLNQHSQELLKYCGLKN